MFLQIDEEIQKIMARNVPEENKKLLYLCDFGRYFEAIVNETPVFVCEHCLDLRLDEERSSNVLCFNGDQPARRHNWREFHDSEELKKYVRENVQKHYVRNS